jgi:FixJ family two-component response regulator
MATIKINARFKSSGVPSTGLSPTVTIYDRGNNTTPVSAESMTEIGDGFYEYLFGSFDIMKDYLFSFDGTATLANSDRYLEAEWSGIDEFVGSISSGGGGSFVQEVAMTEKQFEKLRDKLVGMMEGVEIDFSMSGIEGDVKMAIGELKDKAKEQIEKTAKDILSQNKKLLDKIKNPTVNVTTEEVVVETIDPKDVQKSLDESMKFMDELLGEFAKFVEKGISGLKGMESRSLKQAQKDFLESQLKKLEE